MSPKPFKPTEEQLQIITHDGCAFVTACPGAGKTRVLVERARILLSNRCTGKGIAFLSFTKSAISELEHRLQREALLTSPVFPHFVGTFDSFLWQFFAAPFGVPSCETPPRLIPDKNRIMIRPFQNAQSLLLSCFDRATSKIIPAEARRTGFDLDKRPTSLIQAYETCAASIRRSCRMRGELDFDDVRELAALRLQDEALSPRLANALSSRFSEVIVDEAQDCNPTDLSIIAWLIKAGISTKVVCDPNQSIYGFRGGVTQDLLEFGARFNEKNSLTMNGNFRSSDPICKAIAALRPIHTHVQVNQALGKHACLSTPVRILSYSGKGVPNTVGKIFRGLIEGEGLDVADCPVLASTWASAANAVGQPPKPSGKELSLRLAFAVTDFHFSFEMGNRKTALEKIHHIVLEIEGKLGPMTYRQYLLSEGIEPEMWRPRILKIVRALRFDSDIYPTPDAWLESAKSEIAHCVPAGGKSIGQLLRHSSDLHAALSVPPSSNSPAKSIHSVKGMEFPAVCVVMTPTTARGIIDYLLTGNPINRAEEARKIYVAASRSQRLLAIATPNSQSKRLVTLLDKMNTSFEVVKL